MNAYREIEVNLNRHEGPGRPAVLKIVQAENHPLKPADLSGTVYVFYISPDTMDLRSKKEAHMHLPSEDPEVLDELGELSSQHASSVLTNIRCNTRLPSVTVLRNRVPS